MSDDSDINYLIGGLLFGGIISGPIAFAIFWFVKEVPLGVPFGVCVFGCLLGLGIGYSFCWMAKNRKRKRIARVIKRQVENAPPPIPTQIAGKTCLGCAEHIVFSADGSFCTTCREPFCNRCKERAVICTVCAEKPSD